MDTGASWDLVSDLRQLLEFHFMQNALEAGTIVAVLCGFIGWFVVLRGQTYAGHALSQVGFPGAAGAVLVGIPPILGLLGFCAAAALGIGALGTVAHGERRAESAGIGTILAFALALGFLFARLYRGFVDAAYAFLFGTFLGITDSQVVILLITAVVAVAALTVVARPLLFASVEPDVAAARGVPVRALSTLFLLLMGLAVASASMVTGTLLVFALLVTPAATAQQLTTRPAAGIALSVVIALLVTWLGLAVAYFSVYPVGFYVTSIAFAAYLLARAWRSLSTMRRARPVPA